LNGVDWDEVARGDDGVVLDLKRQWVLEFGDAAVPPTGNSYGLRLVVDRKLWDLGTMVQESPSLAGLPEQATIHLSPVDVAELGLRPGETVMIERKSQTFELAYTTDTCVQRGTAWLPVRLPGFDVRRLMSAGRSVTNVMVRPGRQA
jgi:anaerobic selenocysteine-containing dehydrogenase